MKIREKMKHAFAVDPPGPAEPTPRQRTAVDWVCKQVAKRHLATPGLIALEMSRPLNFIAAQALQFFSPGVWAIARQQTYDQYTQFAAFLEQRGANEYLSRRIEHFERLYEQEQRREKPTDDDKD